MATRRSGPTPPEHLRRTQQVKLRLTGEQRRSLEELAARWGVTVSAAVLRAVQEALDRS